jgi:hypothetical protein
MWPQKGTKTQKRDPKSYVLSIHSGISVHCIPDIFLYCTVKPRVYSPVLLLLRNNRPKSHARPDRIFCVFVPFVAVS